MTAESSKIQRLYRQINCQHAFFQVPSYGADGCQSVSGDSDGARPRENVLPALSDAVWYQTPALSWHHSQGNGRFWFDLSPMNKQNKNLKLNHYTEQIKKTKKLKCLYFQKCSKMYLTVALGKWLFPSGVVQGKEPNKNI